MFILYSTDIITGVKYKLFNIMSLQYNCSGDINVFSLFIVTTKDFYIDGLCEQWKIKHYGILRDFIYLKRQQHIYKKVTHKKLTGHHAGIYYCRIAFKNSQGKKNMQSYNVTD